MKGSKKVPIATIDTEKVMYNGAFIGRQQCTAILKFIPFSQNKIKKTKCMNLATVSK